MLTRQTPWEVLRHAAWHPLFPHDATGDQWFDDDKFNAYTGLGRYAGEEASKAMEALKSEGHPNAAPAPRDAVALAGDERRTPSE